MTQQFSHLSDPQMRFQNSDVKFMPLNHDIATSIFVSYFYANMLFDDEYQQLFCVNDHILTVAALKVKT